MFKFMKILLGSYFFIWILCKASANAEEECGGDRLYGER